MDTQSTSLGRGLFGYRSKDVERMLADRATMLNMAAQRAQAAEARALQLEQVAAQVAELQQHVAQRDEIVARLQAEVADREARLSQIQADDQRKDAELLRMQAEGADRQNALTTSLESEQQLRSEIGELHQRLESEAANRDVVAQDLMRELGPIIAAAEESARRITQNAESESVQKLSDAARTSREAQANLARLTAWRDQLDAVMGAVQNAVGAAQREIEQLPARLGEALRPVIDGMDSVSTGLDELSRTSLPDRVVDQAPPAAPARVAQAAPSEAPEEPEPSEPERELAYAWEPEPAAESDSDSSPFDQDAPAYTAEPEPPVEQVDSGWTVPSHWTDEQP